MEKEILSKTVAKPTNQDRLRIGKAIRALRQQRKIDAKTLAEMTGIDAGNISRIEQGKYSIGLDMLSKIAQSLGCQVEINPLPEKKEESETAKNKRRYKNLNPELLRPINNYDYECYWVSADLLESLGLDLSGVDPETISFIERRMTFARTVIFGNTRCIFDYGRVVGLYVLDLVAQESYISHETREIIYSVSNFVCNLITDNFVKEVEDLDLDELETIFAEVEEYFYELTAKWMYQNNYSKENQDFALKAASFAICTRLTMIPIGNMLENVFPIKHQKELKNYNIWING